MILGVTGGLATGKSLVTGLLRAKGAITFSADEAARAVLVPRGPTIREIEREFGAEMITPQGGLDRARLGQRVFSDPMARERLNRILHPPILRLLRAQIDGAREDFSLDAVIAVEVPLLFETHLESWFERIVVVVASETTQIKRLCARNGLSVEEARRRLAAQWPLAEKVARADIIVENEGSETAVQSAVEAVWRQLRSAPQSL